MARFDVEKAVRTYAERMASGEEPACLLMRRAAERFHRDLQRQNTDGFPYRMDWMRAAMFAEASTLLKHAEGRWRGEPFLLEPFQLFLDAQLFGWVDARGKRRFREMYAKLARKSGKTFWGASVGARAFRLDGEGAPQIVCGATKRDQAMIPFRMVQRLLRDSPLGRGCTILTKQITCRENDGDVFPISSDAKSLDGLNAHIGLIDEIHAHKNSDVADVIRSSTGAREQPLIVLITSGGTLTGGFDEQMMDAARLTLDPASGVSDDRTLYAVFQIDAEDDWRNPEVFRKANPNLGVTVPLEYYTDNLNSVLIGKMREAEYRTKFLGETVSGGAPWLKLNDWDACKEENIDWAALSQVAAPLCAVDLSKNRDLTAFTLRWSLEDGRRYYKPYFFAPADRLIRAEKQNDRKYREWADYIELTGGEELDNDVLVRRLVEECRRFGCCDVGYDQRLGWDVARRIEEAGLRVHKLPVNRYDQMTTPCDRFEQEVKEHRAHHDGNPILRWNIDNLRKRYQSSHNDLLYLPCKAGAALKIDGAVCAIYGGYMDICGGITTGPSVYETRGALVL